MENVIYYLEMSDISEFNEVELKDSSFRLEKNDLKQFKFNKFLYDIVGEPFLWFDKKRWSDNQWREYVLNDNLHTWIAYKHGAIAGYFELQVLESHIVEIKYFGLTTNFIGHGLGSGFLSLAIRESWNLGAHKVVLNTCSKDHPKALRNYMDRGFKLIREVKS